LGQIYALESTTNLTGGSWSSIVTSIAGTGSNVQITDTSTVDRSQRYYRVNWVPATTGYTLTASAGNGGTVSPSGSFIVTAGADQTFTATPNASQVVNHWLLDGSIVQTGGTNYTLNNIQANHSVHVTFNHSLTTISIPQITDVVILGISENYPVLAPFLRIAKT
jgi:hypothetical protein